MLPGWENSGALRDRDAVLPTAANISSSSRSPMRSGCGWETSVSAGTVLSPAWLRGVRVDVLVAKGLLKIVPDQLPLRRNKHPRPFHVTPGDWKSING